jgi:predicted metalloendopeptidase
MNIEGLDWMGPATKAEAFHKLDTFHPKIGYPSKWRDYSAVKIVPDNLVANVMAMRRYYQEDTNKRVGTVPDREEWGMTPQTINAYYNSSFNEIVFPAAILQPPFFDVERRPGGELRRDRRVIGHEMGHGFDDQGSKSDFAGIQRAWWTARTAPASSSASTGSASSTTPTARSRRPASTASSPWARTSATWAACRWRTRPTTSASVASPRR